jgi:hypothetical protein
MINAELIKAASITAIALFLFGAGWVVNGWRYTIKIDKLQAQYAKDGRDAQAAAQARMDAIAKVNASAAVALSAKQVRIKTINSKNVQEFKNAAINNKLDDNCVIDASRLQQLSAAIAANDTAMAAAR